MIYRIGDKLVVLNRGGINEDWHDLGATVTISGLGVDGKITAFSEQTTDVYCYFNGWYRKHGVSLYEDIIL